ncbi:hypothetical protein C3L33_19975, partial [Rhododendron williamsianum]
MNKKEILKLAKGFRGRAKNCIRIARERVEKALHIKLPVLFDKGALLESGSVMKHLARWIWALYCLDSAKVKYGNFMHGLTKENIQLNRKVLSEISMHEPHSFKALVNISHNAFPGNKKVVPPKKEGLAVLLYSEGQLAHTASEEDGTTGKDRLAKTPLEIQTGHSPVPLREPTERKENAKERNLAYTRVRIDGKHSSTSPPLRFTSLLILKQAFVAFGSIVIRIKADEGIGRRGAKTLYIEGYVPYQRCVLVPSSQLTNIYLLKLLIVQIVQKFILSDEFCCNVFFYKQAAVAEFSKFAEL